MRNGIGVLVCAIATIGCEPMSTSDDRIHIGPSEARPLPGRPDRIEQRRYLDGLGAMATFVSELDENGLYRKYVEVDGYAIPFHPEVLNRMERQALYDRFGVMSPVLARAVEAAPDAYHEVAIFPVMRDELAALEAQRSANNPMRPRSTATAFRRRMQTRLDALQHTVAQSGGRSVEVPDSPLPVVFASARGAAIRELSRDPRVSLIAYNQPGRAQLRIPTAPNNVSFHAIDTAFNLQMPPLIANGVNVGVFEMSDCDIFVDHDSFKLLSSYTTATGAPFPCTTAADCATCNHGSFGTSAGTRCMSGECVIDHTTQVASIIASARADGMSFFGFSAAGIDLFLANRGAMSGFDANENVCFAQGTNQAYQDMVNADVRIVNESFGCDAFNDPTLEGQIQDWYARFEDMTIVKAGGYLPDIAACAFTANSICVSSVDESDVLDSVTNFDNAPGTDREDPDIVALGLNNDVAEFASASTFGKQSGTSMAAPSVTATAALLAEDCNGAAPMDHALVHAILRNGALINPSDFRYSTPGLGDRFDGAGRLIAWEARLYCHPEDDSGIPAERGSGTDVIDFTEGEGPPDDKDLTGTFMAPNEMGWFGDEIEYPAMGTREYQLIFEENLLEGDRIRYTMVYDACPAMVMGGPDVGAAAPASVAADMDLGLYHADSQTWVFASQSADDNAEGFDVVVEADGKYQIFLMHSDSATGCTGGTTEPYAWASIIWSQLL